MEILKDDIITAIEAWKHCRVVCFTGKRMHYFYWKKLYYLLVKAWKAARNVEFHDLEHRISLFKFSPFDESQSISGGQVMEMEYRVVDKGCYLLRDDNQILLCRKKSSMPS